MSQVMKIADICCRGQVVSVLEGGYGSYTPKPKGGGHKGNGKQGGGAGGSKNKNSPQSSAAQEASAAAESGTRVTMHTNNHTHLLPSHFVFTIILAF